MFAVLDCGTTTTRVYIVDENRSILASGREKVGVRDTAITGSRDTLRSGITKLFRETLSTLGLEETDISYVIASGMITSELGLMEIPHLIAPAGLHELAESIYEAKSGEVLPIACPVYFIRGIRNDYGENVRAGKLRTVDFMRGEEAQVMGILTETENRGPCTIVALSSHTKLIYVDENNRIAASNTTLSGQLYEAICSATSIGKSLQPCEAEPSGGYSWEALVSIAADCVKNAGLSRTLLMPRFMQVLMRTNSDERRIFTDAALAADDMYAFREMRNWGMVGGRYIFYGHAERCRMYEYMLRQEFGADLRIECIPGAEAQDRLTVNGDIAIALHKGSSKNFT